MSTKTPNKAREILDEFDVLLAHRDKNAFDAGFQAGLQCVQETHAELLEALKMVDEQAALDFSDKQIAQIQAAIARAEGK